MAEDLFLIDGVPVGRTEEPGSADELACIMKSAHDANSTMAAIGSARQLNLGNPPKSVDVGLRTRRLEGIVEYEPDNLTISARAGTRLVDLQNVLAAKNQFLPLDPPDGESTLGGLIATNGSGPVRFHYGTIRDMLIGIKVVHADGTQSQAGGKLVKNVTGYDMCKLYTGSLGTLAVITEATFKVQPETEAMATVVLSYPSLQGAMEAIQSFLRADLMPQAAEVYNRAAFEQVTGEPAGASWLAMLRFGETDAAVRWQIDELRRQVAAAGGAVLNVLGTEESGRFWDKAVSARETSPERASVLLKCSVLYQSIPEAARRISEMGERLDARTLIYCHAGTFILYGRYEWPGTIGDGDRLSGEILQLRAYCHSAGGHLVIERMPSDLKRSIDVWGYEAPALAVMRRIKHQFDPKGLLNPGRFVGGL